MDIDQKLKKKRRVPLRNVYPSIKKVKCFEIFPITIRKIIVVKLIRDNTNESIVSLCNNLPLPHLTYPILIWPASNCERIMHQLVRVAWNWPRWK